jgi:uncharacterized protein YecE (DUF72 family)
VSPAAASSPASRGVPRLLPVWLGCSGWNYKDWRGDFYPAKLPARLWLEHYSERFATVEVNTTFYRLIARSAVERWVEQTPAGFRFAIKGSRYLTHIKRLADMSSGVERFYERIEPLAQAGRLACVLWQLPESFRRDDERLVAALKALPEGRHAFEFRHASWFVPEVYELLRSRGAALVIGDHPERRFQTLEPTADWRYVRFHYGARGRAGNYSERELEQWAQRIHAWRADCEVYAYFNNDWSGFAPRNASWMIGRLDELAGARSTPRRRRAFANR